jgi:polyhydroxyalkanoate synthase subunit PhaC
MSGKLSQGIALLEKAKRFDWAQEINSLSAQAEVIAEAGSIQLLRYKAEKKTAELPMFFIPSFINRYYVLDLLPEKSLLQFYLHSGFDVYLLNWGEPEEEDKLLSLETFFQVHLDYLIAVMKKHAKSSKFHILGQCLGGHIGLIYSLLKPNDVASLSLITTPVDFDHGGKLTDWARHKTLNLDQFIEASGNTPWLWMQMGFLGMKPVQMVTKYKKLFERRNDYQFKRSFLALETWSFDNINVRGQFFLTLIQNFYQNNSWFNEGFEFCKKTLRISDLEVPVAVLNAEDDHIVPIDSTLHQDQVPRVKEFKKWNCRGGHIGALIGGYSQQNVWPEMLKWIQHHDQ